jgi:uncharacterized membrane-anchored protein YitT (DUF2179 family)
MSSPIIKDNIWRTIKEYLVLTLGILIYNSGWAIFMIPNNLVGGGVSGISSIIQYATNGHIMMGYSYFVINAILLLVAFMVLGPSFGGKTIYAIVLASIGLNVLQMVYPQSLIQSISLANGKLMATIMGAMMSGLGIGLAISVGGSTGGTDIIALIVSKYRNISPGRMILLMDVVIILSSLLFPSYNKETGELLSMPDKVTTVVYGLILVTVNSYTLDLYISGSKQSIQLFILSEKYEQIADAITKELRRGVTVLPALGWYTKKTSHALVVITRKTDLNLLLRYIKTIDKDAFLSVSSVSGVYGKGFDLLKGSKVKKFDDEKSSSPESVEGEEKQ